MSELLNTVFLKLLDWGIPFILGLLFRKKVAHALIRLKKWLFNDIVTVKIVSVRCYYPGEIFGFNHQFLEDIKRRIPNMKFLDMFDREVRFTVPIFGNLRLSLNVIPCEEDAVNTQYRDVEEVKMALEPENQVRLGVREIHRLNDFKDWTEVLFNASERFALERSVRIKRNYTILEMSRIGRFEEKRFELVDDDLGSRIEAVPDKLTIVTEPSSQIPKAAEKYLLA